MAFRNLSARISGDASSYVSATERAQRAASDFGSSATSLSGKLQVLQGRTNEAGDEASTLARAARVAGGAVEGLRNDSTSLAAALQVLQGRADEAGDEITSAGARAGASSGAFTALTLSTDGLATSFGVLSTSLTLTLLPALALLSTMLLPIAATIGTVAAAATGLAGAFGLVVGAGVLTHFEQLRSAFKQARTEIVALLEPLGSLLGPLLVQAVQALPTLVENTLAAVGGLESFRDMLVYLGETAFDVIPGIAGTLSELARDSLPLVREFVQYLVETAPGAFEAMRETTEEAGPSLMAFVDTVIEALPELNELGTVLLQDVVPIVTTLTTVFVGVADAVRSVLRWWNSLSPLLRTSIFVLVAGAVGVLSSGLLGLVAAISSVAVAWEAIQKLLGDLSLVQSTKTLITGAASWLKQSGTQLITGAMSAVTDGAETAWDYLTGTGENSLLGDTKATIQDVASWVESTGKEAFESGVSEIKGAWDYFTGTGEGTLYTDMTGVLDGFVEYVTTGEFLEDLKEAAVGLGTDIGNWVEDAAEAAFNWVPDIPTVADVAAPIAGRDPPSDSDDDSDGDDGGGGWSPPLGPITLPLDSMTRVFQAEKPSQAMLTDFGPGVNPKTRTSQSTSSQGSPAVLRVELDGRMQIEEEHGALYAVIEETALGVIEQQGQQSHLQ